MAPHLIEGDWLLFSYWHEGLLAKVIGAEGLAGLAAHGKIPQKFHRRIEKKARALEGRVVLLERTAQPGLLQVKRVTRILQSTTGEFVLWVEGDNKTASTDSRTWGAVSMAEIHGLAKFKYWRSRA